MKEIALGESNASKMELIGCDWSGRGEKAPRLGEIESPPKFGVGTKSAWVEELEGIPPICGSEEA